MDVSRCQAVVVKMILVNLGFLVLSAGLACKAKKAVDFDGSKEQRNFNTSSGTSKDNGYAVRDAGMSIDNTKQSSGNRAIANEGNADTAPIEYIHELQTDLLWLKCPLGQMVKNSKCAGRIEIYEWINAKKACPRGYRLPTKEEVQLLLGDCDKNVLENINGKCESCKSSEKCNGAFPASSSEEEVYWTSTSGVGGKINTAWIYSLKTGILSQYLKGDDYAVRCVRD